VSWLCKGTCLALPVKAEGLLGSIWKKKGKGGGFQEENVSMEREGEEKALSRHIIEKGAAPPKKGRGSSSPYPLTVLRSERRVKGAAKKALAWTTGDANSVVLRGSSTTSQGERKTWVRVRKKGSPGSSPRRTEIDLGS